VQGQRSRAQEVLGVSMEVFMAAVGVWVLLREGQEGRNGAGPPEHPKGETASRVRPTKAQNPSGTIPPESA
jgi:hypothetical protein